MNRMMDIESERNILSVMMESQKIQSKYVRKLLESDFVDPFNRQVFNSIIESSRKALHFDYVAASYQYGAKITDLMKTNGYDNPETWYNILRSINIRNRISELIDNCKSKVYDPKVDHEDILTELSLGNIENRKLSVSMDDETILDGIKDMERMMDRARNSINGLMGMELFGIETADKMLNGAEPGNMIVVAGRPGMGKSIVANRIMCNAVKTNLRVLLWTLEMTKLEYIMRMVSAMSKNNHNHLRSGNIYDKEGYNKATGDIYSSRIVIVEKTGLTVEQMFNYILTIHEQEPLDMVVIDHMGLIVGSGSLYESSTHISKSLKREAKNLGVPVVALSQLSRNVESRGGKKIPQLSDLRDTGSIEQDADKIIFPHRPNYYDPDSMDQDMLFIAKNRGGRIGYVDITFDFDRMDIKELDSLSSFDSKMPESPQVMKPMKIEDLPF